MCEWGNTTRLIMKVGKKAQIIDIDSCIAPIVLALNDAGIETVASCCGHGKIDGSIVLRDGRELVIRKFQERAK